MLYHAALVSKIGFGKLTVRCDANGQLDLAGSHVKMGRRGTSWHKDPPADVDSLAIGGCQIDSEKAIALRGRAVVVRRSLGEKQPRLNPAWSERILLQGFCGSPHRGDHQNAAALESLGTVNCVPQSGSLFAIHGLLKVGAFRERAAGLENYPAGAKMRLE